MNLGQWLGFICLIFSLYILWQIRQILLLAFAAVVLATAMNSAVRRLQKSGLNRGSAVVLTVSITILFFILFFLIVVPPFIEQFQMLVALLPSGLERSRQLLLIVRFYWPSWLPALPDISNLLQDLQPIVTQVFGNFYAIFSGSLSAALQMLLVMVLTLMMLVDPLAYRQVFVRLFPSFYRRRIDEILSECEVALGNWFAGIMLTSLFIAVLSGIGLWILGIKLVLAHALLAGLLNFIPNIGPTLSVIFPVTVALLDVVAPWKAIAVVILYLVIQNIESYLVTPTVMARQVSLLPAVTLLAQIIFASFFGVLGLLLALPLAVIAQVCIKEVLIKDILDNWQRDRDPILTVSPTGVSEMSVSNPQLATQLPVDADPQEDPMNSSVPGDSETRSPE
ncbi:MAG: AI-2E family transporter [Desertifilum sp. SIO1I2]|nr:AI-2E family transporter [Desertifilum sp. SIO1I2]